MEGLTVWNVEQKTGDTVWKVSPFVHSYGTKIEIIDGSLLGFGWGYVPSGGHHGIVFTMNSDTGKIIGSPKILPCYGFCAINSGTSGVSKDFSYVAGVDTDKLGSDSYGFIRKVKTP